MALSEFLQFTHFQMDSLMWTPLFITVSKWWAGAKNFYKLVSFPDNVVLHVCRLADRGVSVDEPHCADQPGERGL